MLAFALLVGGCGRIGYDLLQPAGDGGGCGGVDAGEMDSGEAALDATGPDAGEADGGVLSPGLHMESIIVLGDTGDANAEGLSILADGTIVLGGDYIGELDLGGGPLPVAGGADIFMAAFSSEGAHLWSRGWGRSGSDSFDALHTDDLGITFIVHAQGAIDFGLGPITPLGGDDYLVIQLDTGGGTSWVTNLGTPGDEDGPAHIVSNGDGEWWAALNFEGTAAYAPGAPVAVGGDDAIVVTLATGGVVTGAVTVGSSVLDIATAVDRSTANDIVFGGVVSGDVDLGVGITSARGGADGFVILRASDGATRWAARFGGPGADRITSVAFAPDGSVWIAGDFEGAADLGGVPRTSTGGLDLFLQRRLPTGEPAATVHITGAGGGETEEVVVDREGRACLTGTFADGTDFGEGPVAAMAGDGFVACYGPDGGLLGLFTFGGPGLDEAEGLALDATGHFWISGDVRDTATAGDHTIISRGGADMIIVRLSLF